LSDMAKILLFSHVVFLVSTHQITVEVNPVWRKKNQRLIVLRRCSTICSKQG
jgi:hypothetical protein